MGNGSEFSRVTRGLTFAVGTVVALGCQQAEPATTEGGATGSLQLALTAQSTAGIRYRLRDATFELSGPTFVSIDTRDEANADDTMLELDLPVGAYDAELAVGWRLVRVESDGSESGVSAVLTSANPQVFSISEGLTSPVVFRFQVTNGDVDFGGAEIDIEVEDGVTCAPSPETCNGLDDDCDMVIDENAGDIYFADADGDTFGDATAAAQACVQPLGFVVDDGDCNDASAAINPGASEVCDAVDNDCDASVDEGQTTTYYLDNDRDGFGAASMSISACSQPTGYVSNNTDCNDLSSNAWPGQTNYYTIGFGQSFDFNCDGVETPRETTTQQCNGWQCTAGWVGGVPGCGQSGVFGFCSGFLGSCGGTQTRTQACR